MSGGVDSSVVAANWRARAMTWSASRCSFTTTARRWAKKGACCAGRDIHDARRVAETLGFPHYVLDYENTFRAAVIDEFADAYLAGATPVPCIRCNERVKFRDLLETARDLEADCMATGHYIQRKMGAAGPELHMAADPRATSPISCSRPRAEQLDYLRFPLGGLPPRPRRGRWRRARAGGGRQARQPGHLLRAERQLRRGDREAAPRRGRSGRDRGHGRATCWAGIAA
jgi:tRNA-uridine 2-sulfurtransferase